MKNRCIYIITFLLLCLFRLTAQQFPVQVAVQVLPPYSVYLSDYASAIDEKLVATVLLTDINQSDLQIKLRLSILGDGITIQTIKNFTPTPIHIQGGAATRITGADIAAYLDPLNLDFQGLSKSDFLKSGKLPEGIYQFCVEVLEYRRGAVISNKGVAIAWLILNDPPRWTLPLTDAKLTATDPQNIFFSWMPMHTGSPNAAFSTEYEFTMVEIWPDNRNPNDAINTSIPFYKTTTRNNNYLFGPAEPPLVPGRKYACRLRAYDVDGKDMFKNRGYSEVLSFTFGDACKVPLNINHTGVNAFQEQIAWDPIYNHTGYVVHYREQTADGFSEWYEDQTTDNPHFIKSLKAEKTYEYQVKALCGTVSSDYSASQMFTTLKAATSQVNCDNTGGITPPDNSLPIATLKIGDVINVGGFKATLTEVTGGNGTFTGKCIVDVTTFGVRVRSHFTNISINQSKQVTAGEVVADRNELKLINTDMLAQNVKTDASYFQNLLSDDPTLAGIILEMDKNNQLSPEAKDALQKIDDGKKMMAEGERLKAEGKTEEGQAMIDKGSAMVAEGKQALKEIAGMKTNKLSEQLITFSADANQKYGFDTKQYQALAGDYESYFDKEKEISFPWKALEINAPDKVIAIPEKGTDVSTIVFRDANGNEIKPTGKENLQLQVMGAAADMQEGDVTAYKVTKDSDKINEDAIGKLKTASYKKLSPKLYIVPVNGAKGTIDQVQLNKIYSQAVVEWSITVKDSIKVIDWDLDKNTKFDDGQNEILSNYTAEMNNVIEKYKAVEPNYEKDAYYLFLIPHVPATANKTGQMPLRSQWGFLFTANTTDLTQTAAHELGHGAFRLQHTFSEYPALLQSSTDNLMDYSNKTALYKYQWNNIHDPKWGLYMFQEESEGSSMSNEKILLEVIREQNNKGKTDYLDVFPYLKSPQEWKDYSIGNKKLSYFRQSSNINYLTKQKTQFMFQTSEMDKKTTSTTESPTKTESYIDYTFHAKNTVANIVKEGDKIFHFTVKSSEALKFERYIYAKKDIMLNVSFVTQISKELKGKMGAYSKYGDCHYCQDFTCTDTLKITKDSKTKDSIIHYNNDCCNVASHFMAISAGSNPVSSSVVTCVFTNKTDFSVINSQLYSIINKNLEKGLPVIVGVHISEYTTSTKHFILIIGRHYDDDGKETLYFHDPGTSKGDGSSYKNTLYFDENKNIFKGKKPYKNESDDIDYTITKIYDNN